MGTVINSGRERSRNWVRWMVCFARGFAEAMKTLNWIMNYTLSAHQSLNKLFDQLFFRSPRSWPCPNSHGWDRTLLMCNILLSPLPFHGPCSPFLQPAVKGHFCWTTLVPRGEDKASSSLVFTVQWDHNFCLLIPRSLVYIDWVLGLNNSFGDGCLVQSTSSFFFSFISKLEGKMWVCESLGSAQL